MTATMIIILVSLYKARYLDLDYIASFNAMDSLHLITACSSGNVHTVSFPDYSQDIGLFSKDVEVGLSEKKAGSGATGFHFSLSGYKAPFNTRSFHAAYKSLALDR
jgi:hypothetical protein